MKIKRTIYGRRYKSLMDNAPLEVVGSFLRDDNADVVGKDRVELKKMCRRRLTASIEIKTVAPTAGFTFADMFVPAISTAEGCKHVFITRHESEQGREIVINTLCLDVQAVGEWIDIQGVIECVNNIVPVNSGVHRFWWQVKIINGNIEVLEVA